MVNHDKLSQQSSTCNIIISNGGINAINRFYVVYFISKLLILF